MLQPWRGDKEKIRKGKMGLPMKREYTIDPQSENLRAAGNSAPMTVHARQSSPVVSPQLVLSQRRSCQIVLNRGGDNSTTGAPILAASKTLDFGLRTL